METIVFVGAGSMAEAVIAGICNHTTVTPAHVYVMNRTNDTRLAELQSQYGISLVSADKRELRNADVIVFATKPKDAAAAMNQVVHLIPEQAIILSVLAGVPISAFEKVLGKRPIARSMPNTSATIGKSATGVAWNEAVTASDKQSILGLLNSFGIVKEVEEEDLHAVTALSGSGPAYVYYLAEALETAAVQAGLEKETARDLIIQTIDGAACMLRQTKEEPASLRENVTSPGGTTEAGLQALAHGGFHDAVYQCIQHAQQRSRELGLSAARGSASPS